MGEQSRTGDLQLDQDLDFERRTWTVERVGWAVMAVVLLAALAGVFGAGPLSRTTAGDRGGPLWVEYSRVARIRAPLTLRVHVGPNASQQGRGRVWLSREYLEGVQVERVTPQPERVEAGSGQLTYVFAVADPSRATAVTFSLKMEQIGRQHGCVGLVPGAAMSPPPGPPPLEGEGWVGGRVTGRVFMAGST